jgi:hypothetical protein
MEVIPMLLKTYFMNLSFLLVLTTTTIVSPFSSASTKEKCPDSFHQFWTLFRKSIEKDRMKDIKFLSRFPMKLVSGDGKQTKDLTPSQFQNIFYKIMGEKCDIMDSKNQRQWILKFKELPVQSSFFTCTKKWAQFCNFDFSLENTTWHLTKISSTQKELLSQ